MNHPDEEQKTEAPDGRPMSVQPAWREAFPIDVAQDDYVARRDFTKFLGLTSLAFVAGQFWIIFENWLRKRRGKPEWHEIARVDQVKTGDVIPFHYPSADDACLLICLGSGNFVAYDQKCTHLSCAVVPEKTGDCVGQLHCPCHHGCFDVATGRPLAGPPRRPLNRIALQIVENVIYATDVELRSV